MAYRQVRRGLLEGLYRCAGRDWEFESLLSFLQPAASAPGIELSDSGSCVLRRECHKNRHAQDRPCCRSSFIGHPRATFFSHARKFRKDAASRRHFLMSFKGMRKSIRTMEAPTPKADAPTHLSDEFPAGYSLTRCSPAELVSASPAGVEYASGITQLRGLLLTNELEQPIQHDGGSILIHPFFCPNNGVHPTHQLAECQPIGITQVRELPNPFSDSEIRLGTPKSVL